MSKKFGNICHHSKINKIKIDELSDKSKEDDSDSFTDEIYKIAMGYFDQSGNIPESELDEKVRFIKSPKEFPNTSLLNSFSKQKNASLSNSNLSLNSDKTTATSLDGKNNKFSLSIDNDFFSYDNKKINIINIISGINKNTMLEIQNIPKKYSLKSFNEELSSKGFKFKYDYLFFEETDRYTDDINESNLNDININEDYHKAFINFVDPLHILIFYELYQNKFFEIKSKKTINIIYSEHKLKRKLNLMDENEKKNSSENKKNVQTLIEIPFKYWDLYKSFNPKDHCMLILNTIFETETFIVKRESN